MKKTLMRKALKNYGNYGKRAFCLALSFLMILGLLPMGTMPAYAASSVALDTVAEAEAAVLDNAYAVKDDANAFGGKFVHIPPVWENSSVYVSPGSADKCLDPAEMENADIAVTFTVPVDDDYQLWVRFNPDWGYNNGFWFAWDDGVYTDVYLNNSARGEFKWRTDVKLKVALSAGEHTFYIKHRIANMLFDAFYLTFPGSDAPRESGDEGGGEIPAHTPFVSPFDPPDIVPPAGGHPRLMFREQDIPTIRENMNTDQNAAAVVEMNRLLEEGTTGELPAASNNFDGRVLGIIEALAFDYAVNGNEQSGQNAVDAIKAFLPDVRFGDAYDKIRPMGTTIFTASQVYDWCYDLLTEDDKKHLVYYSEKIAMELEVGWPPSELSPIAGHTGEAMILRDLLSFGIATYDEHPDIYDYVAGRFFDQFVPARNTLYQAHAHHQGDAYGPYRFVWDLWSAYLFRGMSGEDVYSPDMVSVAYEWIYARRPDGQLLRNGDDYKETGIARNVYYNEAPLYLLAANYFNDEYLKYEAIVQNPNIAIFAYDNFALTPVQILVYNDPSLGTKPYRSLPYSTYLDSPRGTMLARTGWAGGKNAPTVLAYMNIGEQWGSNHQHLDAGSFQLYYKGILAGESGVYDSYNTPQDKNYNKRTIAHNSLTIYDPDEQFLLYGNDPTANDGGQRWPNSGNEPGDYEIWMSGSYQTGEVLGHEFGPDAKYPEYSYIKGDITDAYSDKAEEVLRSMLFLPLEDPDHPAVMIVMDKVVASDPEYKKAFLLHMQQEPTVDGNKTVVVNNENGYNGRMVNETLLPINSTIMKIGGQGQEFVVDGQNYPPNQTYADNLALEAGWGRVEISPAEDSKTDYFLNVMTVSDADTTAPDLTSTLLEGDGYVGAVIADRAAIFAKDTGRLSDEVSFTLPGTGGFKVFISGIQEGTWTVDQSGEDVIATVEGGAVYFTAEAGSEVTLRYKNSNAVREPGEPLPGDESQSGIGLYVNQTAVYASVDPIPRDNDLLVPGALLFEKLKATEIAYNAETGTLAGITKEGVRVSLQKGANTARFGNRLLALIAVPEEVKGMLMIPATFLTDAFYADVQYDEVLIRVMIDAGSAPATGTVAMIVGGEDDRPNVYNGQYGTYAWDGNMDTLWSSSIENSWFSVEFDREYVIEGIELYLNNAAQRRAYFELEYSTDGTTYTKLGGFTANGETFGEFFSLDKPVAAKYFRYVNKGSSRGDFWCGVNEIRFLSGVYGAGRADTASLMSLYDTWKDVDGSVYTKNSWDAFTAALAEAVRVLLSDDPTQPEVDMVYSMLQKASAGLTRPSVPANPGATPTITPTPALSPTTEPVRDIVTVSELKAAIASGRDYAAEVKDENGKVVYSWTFTKQNLKKADEDALTDIKLGLEVKKLDTDATIYNLLTKKDLKATGLIIRFEHDGVLPVQASVKIYVGGLEPEKGKRIYLYHYNPEAGKLETLPHSSNYEVDEDGYITIEILHCSDYVVLPKEADTGAYTSLRNQISISPARLELFTGGGKYSQASIQVTLPPTLELVKRLKEETSASAAGAVTITYQSHNIKVATVTSDGVITAQGKGIAKITATATLYSGKMKNFTTTVTVKDPGIRITKSISTMKLGSTFTFGAAAEGYDEGSIVWMTSERGIVVIDKKTGRAVAKTKGTDYVEARINGRGVKVKVIVK